MADGCEQTKQGKELVRVSIYKSWYSRVIGPIE
jgi:hypothetical protein